MAFILDYNLNEYKKDLIRARDLSAPNRGAAYAAAAKRVKAAILINHLIRVAESHDLDMTITLAEQIIKGWTGGHAIAKDGLLRYFAISGRDASNKSDSYQVRDFIIRINKSKVKSKIRAANSSMKKLRKQEKEQMKEIENQLNLKAS